jgi:hypothetical protein
VGREVDFGQGVKAIVCPHLTTCKVIPSAMQGAVHSHKRCVKQRGRVNSWRQAHIIATLSQYLAEAAREGGELAPAALRWLQHEEDIGDRELMEYLSKRIKAEQPGRERYESRKRAKDVR